MKLTHILFFVALFYTLGLSSCSNTTKESSEKTREIKEPTEEDLIVRGKYLVETMGCHDCHSPKKLGPNGPEIIPELILSGYPAERPIVKFNDPMIKQGFAMFYPDLTAGAGPWGVSFAANLTPRCHRNRYMVGITV
jgi:hypothetical protein